MNTPKIQLTDIPSQFPVIEKTIARLDVPVPQILIEVENRRHHLKVTAIANRSGMLKAPRHGNMDREIFESLNSTLEIELSDSRGNLIFKSQGTYAGLEVVGDIARYIT